MRAVIVASLLLMSPVLAGERVSIRAMLDDARYWPPACERSVCVLTGLGGIVSVWTRHVRRNAGKRFVVQGVCASACEIAARRANAERMPGARLIPHVPRPAVWH